MTYNVFGGMLNPNLLLVSRHIRFVNCSVVDDVWLLSFVLLDLLDCSCGCCVGDDEEEGAEDEDGEGAELDEVTDSQGISLGFCPEIS